MIFFSNFVALYEPFMETISKLSTFQGGRVGGWSVGGVADRVVALKHIIMLNHVFERAWSLPGPTFLSTITVIETGLISTDFC